MRYVRNMLVAAIAFGMSLGVSAQGMHGMNGDTNNQNRQRGMGNGSGGMMGMMSQKHDGNMMNGMMGDMMTGGHSRMGLQVPSVSTILAQGNDLDLSGEQTQTLERQQVNLKKQVIRNRADSKIARLDLAEALANPDPNQKDIEKALEKVSAKQQDARIALLDSYFKGLGVLTTEQQDQVVAYSGGCGMMQGLQRPSGQSSSEMRR